MQSPREFGFFTIASSVIPTLSSLSTSSESENYPHDSQPLPKLGLQAPHTPGWPTAHDTSVHTRSPLFHIATPPFSHAHRPTQPRPPPDPATPSALPGGGYTTGPTLQFIRWRQRLATLTKLLPHRVQLARPLCTARWWERCDQGTRSRQPAIGHTYRMRPSAVSSWWRISSWARPPAGTAHTSPSHRAASRRRPLRAAPLR